MEERKNSESVNSRDLLLSRILKPPEKSRRDSQTSLASLTSLRTTLSSTIDGSSPVTPTDTVGAGGVTRAAPPTMMSSPGGGGEDDTNDQFLAWAHSLSFTLTFHHVNYPTWAAGPEKPLKYLPVPLAPLPGIPLIPTDLDIPFTQILDLDCFVDTIDGLLQSRGYPSMSASSVELVYVSYTLRDGSRPRTAIYQLESVPLLIGPWAKEVWLGHLDEVAGYCACETCSTERTGGGDSMSVAALRGHGLEVQVVFPQGSDARKEGDGTVKKPEQWAGKDKLPLTIRA